MGQSPLTGPAQGKTWVYSPACTFLLPERGKKLPAASTHPAACPQGTRVSLLPCPGTLGPPSACASPSSGPRPRAPSGL